MNQQTSNNHPCVPSPAAEADVAQGYFRSNLRRKLEQDIPEFEENWQSFRQSWNGLVKDTYMGDGGDYRYRRYAVFKQSAGTHPELLDDQRHYQSRAFNDLNGGIYREYPCFAQETLCSPVFSSLLTCASDAVRQARPEVEQWRFETHQFRILASTEESGRPVPEGIHQDGVDYVFVFLVDRVNVRGGVSRIYKPDGHLMTELKLRNPMDYMVVNDRRVFHYVTPLYPRRPDQEARRDVLVITVRSLGTQAIGQAA